MRLAARIEQSKGDMSALELEAWLLTRRPSPWGVLFVRLFGIDCQEKCSNRKFGERDEEGWEG